MEDCDLAQIKSTWSGNGNADERLFCGSTSPCKNPPPQITNILNRTQTEKENKSCGISGTHSQRKGKWLFLQLSGLLSSFDVFTLRRSLTCPTLKACTIFVKATVRHRHNKLCNHLFLLAV